MFNCIKPRKITVKIKPEKYGKYLDYPIENHYREKTILTACGKCQYCRKRYAGIGSKRCEMETIVEQEKNQKNNGFLTLTYDEQHKPITNIKKKQLKTTCLKHTQNFIKKLRNQNRKQKIRYVACGELGDKTNRLHCHMLLGNVKLKKIPYGNSKSGEPLYLDEKINNCGNMGMVGIGELTPKSANYCFSYSAKNYIAKFQSQGIGREFLTKHGNLVENEINYQNKYFMKLIRKIIGDEAYLDRILGNEKHRKEQTKEEMEKHFAQCKIKLDSILSKMLQKRDGSY